MTGLLRRVLVGAANGGAGNKPLPIIPSAIFLFSHYVWEKMDLTSVLVIVNLILNGELVLEDNQWKVKHSDGSKCIYVNNEWSWFNADGTVNPEKNCFYNIIPNPPQPWVPDPNDDGPVYPPDPDDHNGMNIPDNPPNGLPDQVPPGSAPVIVNNRWTVYHPDGSGCVYFTDVNGYPPTWMWLEKSGEVAFDKNCFTTPFS